MRDEHEPFERLVMSLIDLFQRLGTPRAMEAGKHLFRAGERDESVYFVRQGFLKAYYLTDDGRELVKSLLGPGATIGSMSATGERDVATYALVARTPCELLAIPCERLFAEARNDHAVAVQLLDFLSALARRKERREYELLCLSAPERHREALEAVATFGDAFSQADIAAYIGITPQALSRIKKRHGDA